MASKRSGDKVLPSGNPGEGLVVVRGCTVQSSGGIIKGAKFRQGGNSCAGATVGFR